MVQRELSILSEATAAEADPVMLSQNIHILSKAGIFVITGRPNLLHPKSAREKRTHKGKHEGMTKGTKSILGRAWTPLLSLADSPIRRWGQRDQQQTLVSPINLGPPPRLLSRRTSYGQRGGLGCFHPHTFCILFHILPACGPRLYALQ